VQGTFVGPHRFGWFALVHRTADAQPAPVVGGVSDLAFGAIHLAALTETRVGVA